MYNRLDIAISQGSFRKIREWNRRRNYYLKALRLNLRVLAAKLRWDARRKKALDLADVKTILLLRNEGTIGDMVIYTTLVKGLAEAGYSVDVLLTRGSATVLQHNPHVRTVYAAEDASHRQYIRDFHHTVPPGTMVELQNNRYDLIIDPSISDTPVHRMKLLHDIGAGHVVGFNKWRGFNRYSHSLDFNDETAHIGRSVAVLADFFGLRAITLPPYDLHVPVEVDNEVKNYLATSGSARNVIINIFTGSPERCFSEAQLCRIIAMIRQRYADVRIILLDHRRQLTLPLPPGVAAHPFSTLQHVMALIRRADLIISPDTAIVHIAAAWQKPLVSVYKNVVDNNDLWAPGYPQASQIIVQRRSIREVEAVPELIMEQIQLRGWL